MQVSPPVPVLVSSAGPGSGSCSWGRPALRREGPWFVHRGCTALWSCPGVQGPPHRTLTGAGALSALTTAIPGGAGWYLRVVVTCVALTICDSEHLPVGPSAIGVSSLQKRLLGSSAQFLTGLFLLLSCVHCPYWGERVLPDRALGTPSLSLGSCTHCVVSGLERLVPQVTEAP